MKQYVTAGTVAGALSLLAVLAGSFGKPALAAFLSDSSTAQVVLTVAGGIGGLIAGVLNGIRQVTPPAK